MNGHSTNSTLRHLQITPATVRKGMENGLETSAGPPSLVGTWRLQSLVTEVIFYELEGDTLTITTAPAKSPLDGQEGKSLLVWKKVPNLD